MDCMDYMALRSGFEHVVMRMYVLVLVLKLALAKARLDGQNVTISQHNNLYGVPVLSYT
jgi:hypothetical protein